MRIFSLGESFLFYFFVNRCSLLAGVKKKIYFPLGFSLRKILKMILLFAVFGEKKIIFSLFWAFWGIFFFFSFSLIVFRFWPGPEKKIFFVGKIFFFFFGMENECSVGKSGRALVPQPQTRAARKKQKQKNEKQKTLPRGSL